MNFVIPKERWNHIEGCIGIGQIPEGSYFIIPSALNFKGFVFERAVRRPQSDRYDLWEVGKMDRFPHTADMLYVVCIVTPQESALNNPAPSVHSMPA